MSDHLPDIDDETESALHELELGIEGLRKAHGYLVQFHHVTGHAMEHFNEAESHLRDAGHDELADHIRDEILPCGVLGGDRWTYELVESFETGFLLDIEDLLQRFHPKALHRFFGFLLDAEIEQVVVELGSNQKLC